MQYLLNIKYLGKHRVKSIVLFISLTIGFILAEVLSITIYPSTSVSLAQALPPCSAIPRLLQASDSKAAALIPPTVSSKSVPGPAPQIDRVGFPKNYQNDFKLIYVVDRLDNKQVRVICGNEIAAAVKPGQPFAYGTIFVMEIYSAKQDSEGNIVKDEKGQYIRETLTAIYVHRKEKGFGADYLENRSGEWEYIGYQPDQTYLSNGAPGNTNACAACHLKLAGKSEDYVFRQE